MIQTRIIAYRHATISSTADDDDVTNNNTNNDNTNNDKDDCRSGNILSSSRNSRNNWYCFLLEVTQKGQLILNPTEDTVKGPIRLRLVSSRSSSTS